MNRRKLLKKIAGGAFRNVSFRDARNLIEGFNFHLIRVSGSHHIFAHPDVPQQINMQDHKGEAKPYQLRQFLSLVERYNLSMEDDAE